MGNVARVFLRDAKRLLKTPAAWSVVLFLCVLPSLYTWFNVAAFWNPYDSTGNLRVCVVNEDEGALDDTLGTLDLGSQIVEELQGNDQLEWAFVSREQAMDEVNAGTAYAAFVIPPDFSADVTTILSGDFQQPTLEYYVNEKTGPVSPKITDTGANSLDTTINDAFFSTASSTVAATLNERLADSRQALETGKSNAVAKITEAEGNLARARDALAQLADEADDARGKTAQARDALAEAGVHAADLSDKLAEATRHAADVNTKIATVSGSAQNALNQGTGTLTGAVNTSLAALVKTSAAIARAQMALADMESVGTNVDWEGIERSLGDADEALQDMTQTMEAQARDARAEAAELGANMTQTAVPALSAALADITAASSGLSAAISSQRLLVEQAMLALDELDSTLTLSAEALAKTDRVLANLEDDLAIVRTDLSALGASGALARIAGDGGVDAEKLADFMMSPTQVTTEELYPINAYGSSMAPLFINLTLWIGVFMLMVIIKLEVDDENVERLTTAQRFFGRWLLLAPLAAIQAAVCCTGCIALGVQTANAALFYLTAIAASLSYLAIQYTLSSTLQHVGKALCIILVFVQIPGGTGLYPIEMTPDFFRSIYPLFPFTYGINAIRETISGFYGSSWAYYIAVLAGFFAAFMAIGALVRPYTANLNRLFAREIEESDLVNGESVELPARRYRMSQVIRAFADRDEYRAEITARIGRFNELYPLLKGAALCVGVGVPVVGTAILGFAGVDKVIVLTTWLAWFVLVVVYLIVVEYLQDYLNHLVSLEAMSADEMRTVYAQREAYTRVRPLGGPARGSGHAGSEAGAARERRPEGQSEGEAESPRDGQAESPRDGDGEAAGDGQGPRDPRGGDHE